MSEASAIPTALVLGDLEIVSFAATRFALDGGAMFGVVPKTLWSREHPADDENRIALVARVLVVTNRRAGYRALVDAGLGDAWTPREMRQYAIEPVALCTALTHAGIDPDTITDVVLTHLHWDHAGGIVTGDPNAPRASLPRARLHVGSDHLAYADATAAKDRASFRAGEMSLARAPATILAAPGEILPGLFAWASNGHTRSLLVVEARGGGQRVIFPADLLPMRAHAKPAWGMAYDNFPLTLVEEKTRLVQGAARDGAIIVLEHDPRCAAIRVREEGGRWVSEEAVALRDAVVSRPA